jgi:hypothetical protein
VGILGISLFVQQRLPKFSHTTYITLLIGKYSLSALLKDSM